MKKVYDKFNLGLCYGNGQSTESAVRKKKNSLRGNEEETLRGSRLKIEYRV